MTEGGAAEVLQRLAHTYLGPDVVFHPCRTRRPGLSRGSRRSGSAESARGTPTRLTNAPPSPKQVRVTGRGGACPGQRPSEFRAEAIPSPLPKFPTDHASAPRTSYRGNATFNPVAEADAKDHPLAADEDVWHLLLSLALSVTRQRMCHLLRR